MPAETAAAVCCLIFGGVLERFPKLKFCFAHGGTVLSILSICTKEMKRNPPPPNIFRVHIQTGYPINYLQFLFLSPSIK